MDDSIRIKATPRDKETGKYKNPSSVLDERELAYNGVEQALYIGDGGQHIKLCQAEDVGRATEPVTAVSEDAELGEVIAKLNHLISAMKESGLMKEQE